MKSKIYYNFLNEDILLEGYLNDCNNENILRDAIVKYEYDFTKIRSIHSNDKEFLLQDKFQGNYTPVF
jgi:hypothetical protein